MSARERKGINARLFLCLPGSYVAGELEKGSVAETRGLGALARPPADAKARGAAALATPAVSAYDLVTKDALRPDLLAEHSYAADRDVLAAVDYAVCARARTFIGNSVSTFSAHLLLEVRLRAYARGFSR